MKLVPVMSPNASVPPEYEYLTVKEVATLLKTSTAWVRDHAAPAPGKRPRRMPVIPVHRLGSYHRAELRFRLEDVHAFMASCYVDGQSGRI
jgi:hypothetical protein